MPSGRTSRPAPQATDLLATHQACSGKRQNNPCRRHHECKLGDQTRDDADKEPREERCCGRSQTSLYNGMRTHLSLNKDAPISRAAENAGRIICRPILGGLHHLYARARFAVGATLIGRVAPISKAEMATASTPCSPPPASTSACSCALVRGAFARIVLIFS